MLKEMSNRHFEWISGKKFIRTLIVSVRWRLVNLSLRRIQSKFRDRSEFVGWRKPASKTRPSNRRSCRLSHYRELARNHRSLPRKKKGIDSTKWPRSAEARENLIPAKTTLHFSHFPFSVRQTPGTRDREKKSVDKGPLHAAESEK